ncbi:hypothetical protein AGMMS4957_17950 [Bacteroidia bacterium]|nr:hypothetical protein AGMMS4957_17950 [Bacteroidia bacterium]
MEKCKVIIDTNLWVSLLIGKKLLEMRALCDDTRLSIYTCDKLNDEFLNVSLRTKVRRYVTEQSISDVLRLITSSCINTQVLVNAISTIRDRNDLYLLSLADTISANYLITGDKDLLILQHHNQTKIVTYTGFMTILGTMDCGSSPQ